MSRSAIYKSAADGKKTPHFAANPSQSQSDFARLIREIFKDAEIPCQFVLPAGEKLHLGPPSAPAFTVTFHSEKMLKKGFGEFAFSQAYVEGDVEIEGDMSSLFEMRQYLRGGLSSWFMVKMWLRMLLRNPIRLNREAIARHYNFGDDFYLAFIDRKYHLYSHGHFATDDETLEEAAEHKMQNMAQALGLKPGMRLLDIGAGWGAITRYAGPRAVHVTALTIAEDSYGLHRELIENNKLEHCQVLLEDFLEHAPAEPYDAIVIYGVIEHIPHYRRFAAQVWKCLKPGGRIFLDGSAVLEKYRVSNFIRQYIYPNNHSYLCLPDLLQEFLMHGFKVLETTDETHDYDLTLYHWAKRFEASREIIVARWGEQVFRSFRLYLWGGSHAMRHRTLQAYHLVAERTAEPGIRPGLGKRLRYFIRSLT